MMWPFHATCIGDCYHKKLMAHWVVWMKLFGSSPLSCNLASGFEIHLRMAKRPRGYQQQLAQAKAEEEETRLPSKLANALLEKWSWGAMSAPDVQHLADAAWQDGLSHPSVGQLAKIGGRGKYAGNMHRDLMHITGQGNLLHDCLSKHTIPVKKGKMLSQDVSLDFLLPHKLFATLYHTLPEAFRSSILGGSKRNIASFWKAMKNHPNLASRPELRDRADLHQVVPLALHGDGVAYVQRARAGSKSLEALSWCSLLTRGPTKVSSFLMFLLCKSEVKEGLPFSTWSRVWQILCWSLQTMATGLWPTHDWKGREFQEEDGEDFVKKGTPLADGMCAVVWTLRADLEFLSNHFKLNSPASNSPCSLCRADRDLNSKPWTDCRSSAAWRKEVWDAALWAEATPTRHVFFKMPSSGLDLVFPDLMHCKHLGTDQVLLGSVLTWLIKHYLGGTIAENLELVWSFIQNWFKVCDPREHPLGSEGLEEVEWMLW